MKFKEVSPETHGCIGNHTVFYRQTAYLKSKTKCRLGKFGCCIFCEQLVLCTERCSYASIASHQPDGIRENLSCNQLQEANFLVWNFLKE